MTGSVRVSLGTGGELQLELPGANGGTRSVTLQPGKELSTIRRVLFAQATTGPGIGQDGAPTQAQVTHWERHHTFPNGRCQFCVSEGRIRPAEQVEKVKQVRRTEIRRGGGVVVSRVAATPVAPGIRPLKHKRSAEELGL